ncbi:MAG: type IV pilus twitching motility protein PilT [Vulcanimicrobiota bacterium]
MKSFNELFNYMVESQTSHLLIIPGSPVMAKKDDEMRPLDSHVLTPSDTARLANALLTDKQKRKFEENLEIDFSYSIPGLSRYRVNVFRQRGSIAMVIATHPPHPPTMEQLGLPDAIKQMAMEATSGLVIISGPKSSGKSHTLSALLDFITENRKVQVVTFENQIFFLHKNKKGIVCQREKGTDFRTFDKAFASLRHQACDILVVTEFETFEVIDKCLEMAAGGRLVIATAEAPNNGIMMEKIINLYPPHQRGQILQMLSLGLNAMTNQILAKKASGDGLIPVFEILINVPQIKKLLIEDKLNLIKSFIQSHGKPLGMQTQEAALSSMLKRKQITQEEAIRRCANPEEFKKMLSMRL